MRVKSEGNALDWGNEILKLKYYFNNDELKRQVSDEITESCD